MEFNHENTMRLINLAKNGDQSAKEQLVTENTPLIKSIVKRYIGKGVEYNDLMQIASMGLLKAIYNFSLDYDVRFSTYAVPMIVGEIKRYLRDDGYIKVSRSIKTTSLKISRFVDDFKKEHNKEPTVNEIADKFNIESSEVIFIMDSSKMPVSLFEKVDNDEKGQCLLDKLPSDQKEEDLINRVILKSIIKELTTKEKKIIILRYFRDYTQGDIANLMGVSQVQISRLENKIIKKIRQKFNVEE